MMFRRDAQVPRTIPLIAERGDELFEMVLCVCEVGFVSAAEFPWDCIVVCLWGLFFDVPRVRFVSVVVVDAAECAVDGFGGRDWGDGSSVVGDEDLPFLTELVFCSAVV
jgi:hypothetical protein